MGYGLDNLRVLVVDHNEYFQQLLRTILQTVGARTVDVAGSAESAFESYCRHEYEMVFTDAELGPLSGFDLIGLIRTSHQSPNPYVPIIMLSDQCRVELVKLARDHGINEFVAKPITVESVLKHLEGVIENPRPFVRTTAYFGPDRRRKPNMQFDRLDRRNSIPAKLTLSRQDITNQQRMALRQNMSGIDELARRQSAVN